MLAAGFGDPVLVVRPHSARPPDGSGRTVGERQPTLGHPLACTVNQARAFAGGSALIHCRTLTGGAQSNSRSTRHGAPLSFRAIVAPSGHGRIEDSAPSGVDVLSIPCRWLDADPLTGARSPALRNSQYLWMRNPSDYAATSFSSASDRSAITPFSKTMPARTRATSCGAFTARQRVWADSISL
jgi:hypothetical protein